MKYIITTALCFAVLLPGAAEASHRSGGVDISDLDDDIVEEFQVPVLLGTDYSRLTPDFGAPRGGGTRSHEGQDMLAPRGAPIVSPTEAVVLGTGVWSGGGNYVQTANPGGERFRYMHLDEIADIKRGDKLNVGDLIGTVGDTGNAGAGVYHLHFEVLDKNGTPQDPYLRLSDESWTAAQKASFLRRAMNNIDDEDDWAELLLANFQNEIIALDAAGERLPDELTDLLEDSDAGDIAELLARLDALIRSIPALLPGELQTGDEGTAVSLLQTYITYVGNGPAVERLKAAGATGYYGPITAAAVAELQSSTDLLASGVFDTKTKVEWTELAK